MYEWRGLWFPDGEIAIRDFMGREYEPHFDGKPTYQYRKWIAASRFVRKHRHAVDIGAHIGLWSRVLIKSFDHLTAFEPMDSYRDCFIKNVNITTGHCTLYPWALGAEEKEVAMRFKNRNSGVTHVDIGAKIWDGVQRAQMRTLDSFDLQNVDFIKIDCEGYEYFVVKGGEKTIRRDHPAIIVEQKESTKDRYGVPFKEAVHLLESWGAHHEMEYGGDHILRWQ